MSLPKVKYEIWENLLKSNRTDEEMLDQIEEENPEVFKLLVAAEEHIHNYGRDEQFPGTCDDVLYTTLMFATSVYEVLRSQFEANELSEQWGTIDETNGN